MEIHRANNIIYQLRFVIAADICSAWKEFGCIAGQFNLVGIITNVSIADNRFIAMTYDASINNCLATFARERTYGVDFQALLPIADFAREDR